jgi:hypothetical protein
MGNFKSKYSVGDEVQLHPSYIRSQTFKVAVVAFLGAGEPVYVLEPKEESWIYTEDRLVLPVADAPDFHKPPSQMNVGNEVPPITEVDLPST